MIAKPRSAATDVHVMYNNVALVMMHTATCVIDAHHPSRRRSHPEYISQKTPETVETSINIRAAPARDISGVMGLGDYISGPCLILHNIPRRTRTYPYNGSAIMATLVTTRR